MLLDAFLYLYVCVYRWGRDVWSVIKKLKMKTVENHTWHKTIFFTFSCIFLPTFMHSSSSSSSSYIFLFFLSNNYVCKCVWSIFIAFYLATFHTKCFSHKFSDVENGWEMKFIFNRSRKKSLSLHFGRSFFLLFLSKRKKRFWEIYYRALLFSTWKLPSIPYRRHHF